jgi:hypothetical protein
MSNEVTEDGDDGFASSLTSSRSRLIKGPLLKWNEITGWNDRDGMKPPEIMVAIAVDEVVQCWKDKKPIETIREKPLPNVEDLNASIPKDEWELGFDGKPQPPWRHEVVVYLIDPSTGGFYTFISHTLGAHAAYDQLCEKVITMRGLRGARVVPIVKLSKRPWKTFVGMKHRPDFEILEYRLWNRNGGDLIGPKLPQIAGPNTDAAAPPAEPQKPADNAAPPPESKSQQKSSAAEATLSTMTKVEEPTTKELLKDEIPW